MCKSTKSTVTFQIILCVSFPVHFLRFFSSSSCFVSILPSNVNEYCLENRKGGDDFLFFLSKILSHTLMYKTKPYRVRRQSRIVNGRKWVSEWMKVNGITMIKISSALETVTVAAESARRIN